MSNDNSLSGTEITNHIKEALVEHISSHSYKGPLIDVVTINGSDLAFHDKAGNVYVFEWIETHHAK